MRKTVCFLVVTSLGCSGDDSNPPSNTNTIDTTSSEVPESSIVASDPPPPVSPPTVQRRVTGLIDVHGIDDETFGPDEEIRVSRTLQFVLDDNRPVTTWQMNDVRWGDECRVEADGTATRMADGGVQLEVEVRLYEGETEGTRDLDGTRTLTFLVPADGSPTNETIVVRNDDEGGDRATLTFRLANLTGS